MGTITPISGLAPLVGEVVAGEAVKVRKELAALLSHINQSTFSIGRLLHVIKSKGYYQGYTTFQEYVSTLEIKPRKAQYLRRIAEVMDALQIFPEIYEPVGVAKLREITSLDIDKEWTNPETQEVTPISVFVIELIGKAPGMSLEEVKAYVRTLKGIGPDQEMVHRNFSLLRQAAEETVDVAIELARAQIGSTHKDDEGISQDASDGRCLEILAVSFLNDPANQVLANG